MFINRRTGKPLTLSNEDISAAEEDDSVDECPEWEQEMIIKAKEIISSDDYMPLPSKFDIHEYQPHVF